jgi:integrase
VPGAAKGPVADITCCRPGELLPILKEKLMDMDIVPNGEPPAPDPEHPIPLTVRQVVETYLTYLDANLNKHHVEECRRVLGVLVQDIGNKPLSECKPLDLLAWFKAHPSWKSPWTVKRINNTVQRAFNWCWRMGLITGNPFRAVTQESGDIRRAMTEQEFRLLLKNSGPLFRRFLLTLRWTGARPIEIRTLRWCDVNLEKGIILLKKHKTFRKTRRPRIIPLIGPLVKLFAWMQRHRHVRHYHHGKPLPYGPTAQALREVLADGPLPIKEVTERVRALGIEVNYRMLWRARKTAGVQIRPVVAPGKGRFLVYQLVDQPAREQSVNAGDTELVFHNEHGRPYTRRMICQKIERLREQLGLPDDCVTYGLRHMWATQAIVRGVSLKMVSTLLGHADSRMAEQHYIHVAELTEPLKQAMEQAVGLNPKSRDLLVQELEALVEKMKHSDSNGQAPKGGQP